MWDEVMSGWAAGGSGRCWQGPVDTARPDSRADGRKHGTGLGDVARAPSKLPDNLVRDSDLDRRNVDKGESEWDNPENIEIMQYDSSLVASCTYLEQDGLHYASGRLAPNGGKSASRPVPRLRRK